MDVIEVNGLRKAYGGRPALHGIDLRVGAGEIVAVLGPNGAGKTTLLEILEGHRRRDHGHVRVLGEDPGRPRSGWRARVGIVLQEQGLLPELTAAEALALYGGYYPRSRPPGELLELVGLADRGGDRVDALSGGARRRLDLAVGLVGCPELLFLDEPTTGFDPDARRQAWSVVEGIRAGGTTVVLTTHYLDEAAVLADRLVIIHGGRVIAEGTPSELASWAGPSIVRFRVPAGLEPPLLPDGATRHADGSVELRAPHPARTVGAVCDWATDAGHDLSDLTVATPSLDDVYLELIGAQPPPAASAPSRPQEVPA